MISTVMHIHLCHPPRTLFVQGGLGHRPASGTDTVK